MQFYDEKTRLLPDDDSVSVKLTGSSGAIDNFKSGLYNGGLRRTWIRERSLASISRSLGSPHSSSESLLSYPAAMSNSR
jgi:hypothetical protein